MTAGVAGRGLQPRTRRLAAMLWLAFTLFIVYGGTIPFHFTLDRAAVVQKLSRIPLNPLVAADTGRRVSVPDVVQNVALFVPFGVFAVLALRERRGAAAAAALAVGAALLLSVSIEILQLFEADRTTSVSDVCANVAGAAIGAGVALAGVKLAAAALGRLEALGLVDTPAFYPFAVAAVVICVAAWQPFDFTLDVSTLSGKLHTLRNDPWQFAIVTDEGVEFVRYALFGLAAALWLRDVGVRAPALGALAGGALVAWTLEASQWAVASRMPALSDAVVQTGGVGAGAALSRGWPHARSSTFWIAVLWLATAAAAALEMLSPFRVLPARRPMTLVPFWNYYQHTSLQTVSHTIELMLLYFPFGFAVAAGLRKRSPWLWAAAGTAAIAAPLECLQGWIDGRYGDVTDILVSLLGAAAGAFTSRYALEPRMR